MRYLLIIPVLLRKKVRLIEVKNLPKVTQLCQNQNTHFMWLFIHSSSLVKLSYIHIKDAGGKLKHFSYQDYGESVD